MTASTLTDPTAYTQAVTAALGDQATPDVLALAEVLAQHAGPDGWTLPGREVPDLAGLTIDQAREAHAAIVPTGLLGSRDGRFRIRTEVPAEPPPSVARTPTQPTRKPARRVPPTTGIEIREPRDQNEHTLAMINSHQLVKNDQLVAMVASVEIAITAARSRVPFGKAERDLSAEYMAGKTGLSENTVRTAMAGAVKAGFLLRVDDAQGGPNGANRARYRACLPTYLDG